MSRVVQTRSKASGVVAAAGVTAVPMALLLLAVSGCGSDAQDLKSGSHHVLVSASSEHGGADVEIRGKVQLVGACLGIGEAVTFWPHGTKIVSEDPLTIDVPGEGKIAVGDIVDGAGASHSIDHPEFDGSEPDTTIPDTCPSKYWFDWRPE